MEGHPVFITEKTDIVKMTILLKISTDSVQSSSEFQQPVSAEIKVYPQVYMELQGTLNNKNIWKKNKFGGLTYYKAMATQTVEYLHKYIHIGQ